MIAYLSQKIKCKSRITGLAFLFIGKMTVIGVMSESVTVERGVRDRFGPQNEQLPVR
jgi:hypothetical protein